MNRTAIVTGGSKGIGYGISCQLAKDGFDVVIMGTSDEESNRENLDWFTENGYMYVYVQGSIANRKDRERLLNIALEQFGKVDLLVNDAGIGPKVRNNILDMAEESFDRVMEVNLKGTVMLSQLVANQMRKQKLVNGQRGIIINVGSMSSKVVSISRGEYCMSKAGLSMWTKLLAAAGAEYGIYAFEVNPGIILTGMTSIVKDKYDKVTSSDEMIVKRWGKPEDVANAVSAFCSGKLNYCTGQSIDVDGGFAMRRL